MTKRNSVGFIYVGVIIASLILRISSSLDVYSALGVQDSDAYYTCMVQILIFGAMPLGLYFLTVGRREGAKAFLSDFAVRRVKFKNWMIVLPISICMIVVSNGVSYVWQSMLSLMGYTRTSSPTDYSSIGVLFKELVLVAVLPGIFEEVTHRGLINAGYRECGYRFILVSAIYFSLMHQNITQTGYTFFAGLVMAALCYYTGSIFPGIFAHFLNNAVAVISEYTSQNGGIFAFALKIEEFIYGTVGGMVLGAVAVVACLALLICMFVILRKNAFKEGIIDREQSRNLLYDTDKNAKPWADIPFIITVVLGVGATLFSLVWGILR